MNFCTLKKYINFIFIKIPVEYKNEFERENNLINIAHIKNISLVIMLFSALTGAFVYFYEKTTLLITTPHAVIMHMVLLLLAAVFFICTNRIEKKNKFNSKFSYIVDKLFALCSLSWAMVFSINAQGTSGQITVYVIGITLIVGAVYIKPIAMAIIYLYVNSAFVIILPYFQQSRALVASHEINSLYLIAIAWFISRLLYQNRLKNYVQKKMIEEKNIELITLNTKLEQLSATDSLTGICNRREFDKVIQNEWNNSIQEKSLLSVALIDIDFFKAYNDSYGHLAGDDCIKMVVNIICSSVKDSTNCIARFGGEEFIAILPNADINRATYICKCIAEAVEALKLPHPNSPLSFVTVSIGVCTIIPTQNYSYEYLVNNADKALYQAKHSGRNRVFSNNIN